MTQTSDPKTSAPGGDTEYKAGHPPATMAGGMRIKESRHVPLNSGGGSARGEGELREKVEKKGENKLPFSLSSRDPWKGEGDVVRTEEEREEKERMLEKLEQRTSMDRKAADRAQRQAEAHRERVPPPRQAGTKALPLQQPRYHN